MLFIKSFNMLAMQTFTGKPFLAAILVALALLERLIFDLGPNVELITLTSLLAAYYLGGNYSFLVPLASLVISDYFIGNTHIFLFTWSGFLVIGLGGLVLKRFKRGSLRLIVGSGACSVVAALFFYLWTNFGVWLIGGLYPLTLAGLFESYHMGLPFLKFNLVSNLLIVPLGFWVVEGVILLVTQRSVIYSIVR